MSVKGFIITEQNVTVNYDGETHIVKRSDALADRLIKALKEGRSHEIPNLVSAAKRIEAYSKGNFVVQNGRVLINGIEAPEVLSSRIIRFSNDGLPFQPLVKFAEKLQKNPSFRAVNELFQFLEKNNHPLTENGNFIAYKKVREDFKDVHSGTFDNSVGKTLEMPRNQVNEDPTQTCSSGLHVANWDYAHNFYVGGPMLEVEVDPTDVVAVPIDYNQAKMRVCRYKVLSVVTQPHDDSVSLRVTDPSYHEGDSSSDECVSCGETGCACDGCGECKYDCDCDCEYCDYCGHVECVCDTCEFCSSSDCYGECQDDEYPYEDEFEG